MKIYTPIGTITNPTLRRAALVLAVITVYPLVALGLPVVLLVDLVYVIYCDIICLGEEYLGEFRDLNRSILLAWAGQSLSKDT